MARVRTTRGCPECDAVPPRRGFFAGLKKRQGITVEVAERIRQVGPNKQGAKGSYTVYRVAE